MKVERKRESARGENTLGENRETGEKMKNKRGEIQGGDAGANRPGLLPIAPFILEYNTWPKRQEGASVGLVSV